MYSTWSTGFDAYWELDIWGRFRRNIEAADAELDASIEDYDAILVALLAETAATYVEYRTAQEQLDFARANVKTQEGSLKIAQDKFEGGVYSELDVTQPMTNLKTTEQLVPLFEARIRDANLRLCTLLGVPPRDLAPELGTGPIPVPGADVAVGVPADLLRRRPTSAPPNGAWPHKAHGSASPPRICSPTSALPVRSGSMRNGSRTCSRKPARPG